MGISSVPAWFQSATLNFYGTASDSSKATDLWDEFLQSEGASAFVTVDPATKKDILLPGKESDPAVRAAYLSFLKGQLKLVYQSESINSLSPMEIGQRKLTFTIMDILITLLKSALTTQLATGAVMAFFAEKEKSYSDLMARTPMYEGTGTIYKKKLLIGDEKYSTTDWSNTVVSYDTDPTKYYLGYANITLSEITNWCANYPVATTITNDVDKTTSVINPKPEGNTAVFVLNTPEYNATILNDKGNPAGTIIVNQAMNFYLYKTSDNKVQVVCTLKNSSEDLNFSSRTLQNPALSANQTYTSSETCGPDPDQASIAGALATAYYNTYNAALNAGVPLNDHPLMIPYAPGILASVVDKADASDSGTEAALSKLAQTRGAANQLLSTYVDALKSKVSLYSDKRDQVKQVVDSSVNARKMTVQIFNSCIDQMTNIISSIYK